MVVEILVEDSKEGSIIEQLSIEGDKKEVINKLNKKYGDLKVKYLHNENYKILLSINDYVYDTLESYVERNIIILKGV